MVYFEWAELSFPQDKLLKLSKRGQKPANLLADARAKHLTRRDLLLDVALTIGNNAPREEALHMVVKTHSIELSRDEIIDQIEDGANRHGMTATQMLVAYSDGTLDDVSAVADLLALAHLLPDEDEVFGGRRLP